ncbi:MAG: HDOD domain-containing protein [Desulfobacteraceae bacterium]|nr:HDOD domain-containing protein [Desulfobacteraceae bacterium]
MENLRKYHVAAGSYYVDSSNGVLLQAYLGTCVGVALYDSISGIGGIIHLLLPEPVSATSALHPEKYASTGLPVFIDTIKKAGAQIENLKACVAGGALVGPLSRQDLDLDIGGRTAETVKTILDARKIPIEQSETGGFFTCCLSLDTRKYKFAIEPAGQLQPGVTLKAKIPTPEDIDRTIENLQPIPQVALKVLRLIGEGEYDIGRIAEEVKKDQVISAKTLQICNSALFAKAQKFDSLDHALVFLGQHQFVKLVLSEAVQGYFNQSDTGYSLCKGGMYHHAVGTATIAEELAKLTNMINPTSAYTAGLLHDIGKVVLDQWVNSTFPLFYRQMREEEANILNIEKKILGTNHTQIGGMLAEKWSFTESLISAVKNHHDLEKDDSDTPLNNMVHMADLLMCQFGSGFELERIDSKMLASRLKALNLSADRFPSIVDLIPLNVLETPPTAEIQ